MEATPKEFGLFAAALLLALAFLPTYSLIGIDLFSRFVLQRDWDLSGVRFDQSDLVILAILLALLLRKKALWQSFWSIPKIKLWIALGCLLSAAYLVGEENQGKLTGPAQIGYQLYRYCWREILYLPLAALLLLDEKRVRVVLYTLLVAADVNSVRAVVEGYQGFRTGGYLGANTAGSALVLPICFALGILLGPRRTQWEPLFCWFSLILIARAVLFSGSRGSFTAVFFAVLFFAVMVSRETASKRRMIKIGALAVLALVCLLVLKPGLSDRPMVARALTTLEPMEQGTMQWRMQERWPYFIEIVKANPWLGTGVTPVAEELGARANTPHQGYIAFAARSGIPALLVALILIIAGFRAGVRLFLSSVDKATSRRGFIGLSCSAAVVGILVHNTVETTIYLDTVAAQLWLSTGLMLAWGRSGPRRRAVSE